MKSIEINYLDSNRRGMRFTGCLMGKDLMMEISSFKFFFNDETKMKRNRQTKPVIQKQKT